MIQSTISHPSAELEHLMQELPEPAKLHFAYARDQATHHEEAHSFIPNHYQCPQFTPTVALQYPILFRSVQRMTTMNKATQIFRKVLPRTPSPLSGSSTPKSKRKTSPINLPNMEWVVRFKNSVGYAPEGKEVHCIILVAPPSVDDQPSSSYIHPSATPNLPSTPGMTSQRAFSFDQDSMEELELPPTTTPMKEGETSSPLPLTQVQTKADLKNSIFSVLSEIFNYPDGLSLAEYEHAIKTSETISVVKWDDHMKKHLGKVPTAGQFHTNFIDDNILKTIDLTCSMRVKKLDFLLNKGEITKKMKDIFMRHHSCMSTVKFKDAIGHNPGERHSRNLEEIRCAKYQAPMSEGSQEAHLSPLEDESYLASFKKLIEELTDECKRALPASRTPSPLLHCEARSPTPVLPCASRNTSPMPEGAQSAKGIATNPTKRKDLFSISFIPPIISMPPQSIPPKK